MTKKDVVNPKSTYFNNVLFVVNAIIFNICVSGVYLASKFNNEAILQILGAIVVLFLIPFTVSLKENYLACYYSAISRPGNGIGLHPENSVQRYFSVAYNLYYCLLCCFI